MPGDARPKLYPRGAGDVPAGTAVLATSETTLKPALRREESLAPGTAGSATFKNQVIHGMKIGREHTLEQAVGISKRMTARQTI